MEELILIEVLTLKANTFKLNSSVQWNVAANNYSGQDSKYKSYKFNQF